MYTVLCGCGVYVLYVDMYRHHSKCVGVSIFSQNANNHAIHRCPVYVIIVVTPKYIRSLVVICLHARY